MIIVVLFVVTLADMKQLIFQKILYLMTRPYIRNIQDANMHIREINIENPVYNYHFENLIKVKKEIKYLKKIEKKNIKWIRKTMRI